MTRRRSFLDQLARDSYRVSRAAGDASAYQRGGSQRLAKRVARRYAARQGYSLLRRWGR